MLTDRRTHRPQAAARLAHVTVTGSDFSASLGFYDAVFGALGLSRLIDLVDEEEDGSEVEAAAWGSAGAPPVVWLVTGAVPTRGLHVEFAAGSADDVRRFHDAAIAHGGTSHAVPRRWTIYCRGRFGATVRDPDGNLIEAVAPE